MSWRFKQIEQALALRRFTTSSKITLNICQWSHSNYRQEEVLIIPTHKIYASDHVHIILAAVKACSILRELETGKLIQNRAFEEGFDSDNYLLNTLINMYSRCGSLLDAQMSFDRIHRPDVVSWTALLLGYAECGKGEQALVLFDRMCEGGLEPDSRAYVAALVACVSLTEKEEGRCKELNGKQKCLEKGRSIHSRVTSSKSCYDVYVANTLIDLYSKCGKMPSAREVFERMPSHTVVSWTVLLLGCVENGQGETALELFDRMRDVEGCPPNSRTFVAALMACASCSDLEQGTQIVGGKLVKIRCLEKGMAIHSQVLKTPGFDHRSQVFVGNTLIDMYSRGGSLWDARAVFDRLGDPLRDSVSWTTIILAYAENKEPQLALELLARMQELGVGFQPQTFVAGLMACSELTDVHTAKLLHGEICMRGVCSNMILIGSLVDCYGKCGRISEAELVFYSLVNNKPDLVSWSSMLSAYTDAGMSHEVLNLFLEMESIGVQPDNVAMLAVLSACGRAGLVEMGMKVAGKMFGGEYRGVRVEVEHYHSVVDMLGRANRLEEALRVVERMSQRNVVTWTTLLGCCHKWGNVKVGRAAFEDLVKLDEREDVGYVLMGNIYGSAGMWEEKKKILSMAMKRS